MPELAEVDNLEKLLLYVRWLVELTNNFVNFSAIYRPSETALVEMGSLVIDGRRLDFCVQVHDRAAHKAIATESLIFLVYAKILAKEGAAAAFEEHLFEQLAGARCTGAARGERAVQGERP